MPAIRPRSRSAQGHLTPVFFGSALNNFGVRELLRGVADLAPPPRPQPAVAPDGPHKIAPEDEAVSGFVFKVQANIDPQHRDRIAFVRMCSGRFRRGMKLKNSRTGRLMAVQNPVFFLARERNLAEEAWPGDIIGIPNHGTLRVGDTLTEGAEIRVTGLPSFAPEILRRVAHRGPDEAEAPAPRADAARRRGRHPPVQAGQRQRRLHHRRRRRPCSSTCCRRGLQAEYGLATRLDGAPYEAARWLDGDRAELDRFRARNSSALAEDHDGVPVFLARNAWDLRTTTEEWPAIRFSATREQH